MNLQEVLTIVGLAVAFESVVVAFMFWAVI